MAMEITTVGGLALEARVDGHTIRTDQPAATGGQDSAPSPFTLFLASLGTCAGFYAVRFCQERGIDSSELRLRLDATRNSETRRLEQVRLDLHLPPGFPDKYRKAILRAVDQCTVKKVLADPPHIETRALD